MTLRFYCQPLSSYWWKVLIALYELDAPFEAIPVDPADAQACADFLKLSPLGKFPGFVDLSRHAQMYEATQIIDHLDQYYPAAEPLLGRDRETAREIGFRDRFFEAYLHVPMMRIMSDRARPDGASDPFVVDQARRQLRAAYDALDRDLEGRAWAAGETFTLADCCAAPLLFYSDVTEPIGDARSTLAGYYRRLRARRSVRRAIQGARPFFNHYPATPQERVRLGIQTALDATDPV